MKKFKWVTGVVLTVAMFATALNVFAFNRISAPLADYNLNTPAEYSFKIAGTDREFVLLDTTNDDSSKFFVFAKNHYGKMSFTNNDKNYHKFDIFNEDNVAYWLNNSFKEKGNTYSDKTYKLPQGIIDHIDNNHVWSVEKANKPTPSQNTPGAETSSAIPDGYTVTCGIALMSGTELLANYMKFGLVDDCESNGWDGWWLRSCREDAGTAQFLLTWIQPTDGTRTRGCTEGGDTDLLKFIRPVFYLNNNFFKNVKLDLSATGSEIKKIIKESCSAQELLKAGYTAYDVCEILGMQYDVEDNELFYVESYSITAKDGTYPVLQDGGSVKINAAVFNKGYEKSNVTVIGAIYDGNMLVAWDSDEKDVSGRSKSNIEISLDITNAVTDPFAVLYTWDSFEGMKPLTGKIKIEDDDGYIGVCEHIHRYQNYEEICNRIIASGAKLVRMSPSWGSIETAKGVYNTTILENFDKVVDIMQANGVTINFVLGHSSDWTVRDKYPGMEKKIADGNTRVRHMPKEEDWADYVSFITKRYKGKITHWEVWNEPDHSKGGGFFGDWDGSWDGIGNSVYNAFTDKSIQEFAKLQKIAYMEAKNTDRNNKVLSTGLSWEDGYRGDGADKNKDWFGRLLDEGAGKYFDIINYHAYGDAVSLINRYNDMAKMIDRYEDDLGGKKIWITETGYSAERKDSDQVRKKDYLNDTYITHKKFPLIEKLIYYNYLDTQTNNIFEDDFGLCDKDLNPKDALYYYQGVNGAHTNFEISDKLPEDSAVVQTLYCVPDVGGITNNGTKNKVIPSGGSMYLKINDRWLYDTNGKLDLNAYIDVTYKDDRIGTWSVYYDSQENADKKAEDVEMTGTGKWVTKTFALGDAKFANQQDYEADFRVYGGTGGVQVTRVAVRKQSNEAKIVLGETDNSKFVFRYFENTPHYRNIVDTKKGIECRKIEDDGDSPGVNGRYFFFRVSDGLIDASDRNISMKIKFWGEKLNANGAGTDYISVMYSDKPGDGTYLKTVKIAKSGEAKWEEATIVLDDAIFQNMLWGYSDIQIGNGGDGSAEYVSEVTFIKN